MQKLYYITSFRDKTKAALYGLSWSIANERPVLFQIREFWYGNMYDIFYTECVEAPTFGTAIGGLGGISRIGG